MSNVKKKMQQKKGAIPQPIHANNSFFISCYMFILFFRLIFSYSCSIPQMLPSSFLHADNRCIFVPTFLP